MVSAAAECFAHGFSWQSSGTELAEDTLIAAPRRLRSSHRVARTVLAVLAGESLQFMLQSCSLPCIKRLLRTNYRHASSVLHCRSSACNIILSTSALLRWQCFCQATEHIEGSAGLDWVCAHAYASAGILCLNLRICLCVCVCVHGSTC